MIQFHQKNLIWRGLVRIVTKKYLQLQKKKKMKLSRQKLDKIQQLRP